ncbi:thiopurine S-methyltransferase [Legionella moravica]|uniref:Thiopurine S-methyltransferase n=1 Tax=Legionella moravica TaxID=39962 RepID=A0A378K349_9GAMM|nr:thiopurine S-methyltransferase [Legionella moravica]KTD34311.1 thiopurine S-methyltransferase [Legionella moravica]STX64028.1 thiopurine S-methyltransferase [Legionella moravica]
MSNGREFWIELWEQGRTAFHEEEVNPGLIKHWPELKLSTPVTVLVPLCGKSLDMLWLAQQGYQVVGIELCEQAVQQFADEQGLLFHKKEFGQIVQYFNEQFSIWVADIFKLPSSFIPPVDAIYDRAALIALPAKLRATYVNVCLNWLKPEGKILLKTMGYNQEEMQGPPYSVTDEEVQALYKNCEEIRSLSSISRVLDASDHFFVRGLKKVKDTVWCIKKAPVYPERG